MSLQSRYVVLAVGMVCLTEPVLTETGPFLTAARHYAAPGPS